MYACVATRTAFAAFGYRRLPGCRSQSASLGAGTETNRPTRVAVFRHPERVVLTLSRILTRVASTPSF
jgi:hypothetical protein